MDEYEFGPPEEVLAWIQAQQDAEQEQSIHGGLDHYILVNGKVKLASLMEWADFMDGSPERFVERSFLPGDVLVSTVFLGLDHGFGGLLAGLKDGCRPVLFETMVFGGKLDHLQWRYSSLGEAKMGHYEIVASINEGREPVLEFGEEGFWSMFMDMFDDHDEGDEDADQ